MPCSINDFKSGDFVYHKSNPFIQMIVSRIDESNNKICCDWIDRNGILNYYEFNPEALDINKNKENIYN
jgi:hypothetical protein